MLVQGAPQRYVPYPDQKPKRSHPYDGHVSSSVPPGPIGALSWAHASQREACAAVALPAGDQCWFRLPHGFLTALAAVGIDSLQKLRDAPESQILQAFCWNDYSAYQDLILEMRRPDGPSAFHVFRLLAKHPAIPGSFQICDFHPIARQAAAGHRHATPSCNVGALQALKRSGWDARVVCDAVADARANAGVRESSAKTYDSHLRGIQFVCLILGEAPLPASLDTIRRVSSVVGNPSTLRGWLAAWRRLHLIARVPWAGDRDPFLVAVRTGLRHCVGPSPPKKRCRRALVRRLATVAVRSQRWDVGALCVLAYVFALRVPSELIAQAAAVRFKCSDRRIVFGPIRRKGKSELQTLRRWCTCVADPLLCPHPWVQILSEIRPSGNFFVQSTAQLMLLVVSMLKGLNISDAACFTSHCFRRGAGIDVLEAHGLSAMLDHGQWSSPRAAEPYASADEQTAQAMGTCLVDNSDDEL